MNKNQTIQYNKAPRHSRSSSSFLGMMDHSYTDVKGGSPQRRQFFIPEALDIPTLLDANGFSRLNKPLMLDKLHYLIDLLSRARFRRTWTIYLPLKAEYLRAVVGKRFATMIKNTLVSLGVIETNGSYRVGFHSTGYRLHPQFWSGKFRPTPITDQKLVRRMERVQRKRFSAAVKGNIARERIARTLAMVQIDFEAAERHLRQFSFGSQHAKAVRLCQLQAFRDRAWYFKPDKQGRIHHNFVGLSNDLKGFATIAGEPIYSVDVGNMQPALLAILYPVPCDEKTRFVALVQRNEFYRFFNERIAEPSDLENDAEKQQLKKLIFRKILFCHNAVQHELLDIFREAFPVLAAAVWEEKKGFHKKLSRKLQRIEASVVIDQVIDELARIEPLMPILSVHDCIATTEPFVTLAQKVLKEKFCALLGFEAPVKAKRVTREVVGAAA